MTQLDWIGDPEPVKGHAVPGMGIWGWMSPAELTWLGKQAASARGVVEIGCLHGRTSYALATNCPGRVYCIDPWEDGSWESWNRNVGSVLPNAVPIRGFSPEVGARVPDPIDLVFIDGAHDYSSVVNDIAYWLPRTQKILCGHDYGHPDYPDVKMVVDELLPGASRVGQTGIWTYPVTGTDS